MAAAVLLIVAAGTALAIIGLSDHQSTRQQVLSAVKARVTSMVSQTGLTMFAFDSYVNIDHSGPTEAHIVITEGQDGAHDRAVVSTNLATIEPSLLEVCTRRQSCGTEVVWHSVVAVLERSGSGGEWIVKSCVLDPPV